MNSCSGYDAAGNRWDFDVNTMATTWVDSNEVPLDKSPDLPTKPATDYVEADTQLASSPPDQSMEAAGSYAGAEDQSLPVPHVLECIRGARAICGVCAGVSTQDGLFEGFRTSYDVHSLLQVRGFVRIGDPASPHAPQRGPRTHAPMLKSDPRPQHTSPDRLSRGTGHVCRGPDLGTWTSHHAPMSWPPRPRSRRPRTPRTGTRPLDTGLRASAHPTVQARYRFPDHCPEPRGPGPRTMAIAPEITHAPAPYNIPSHTRRRPADPIPLTPILPRSRCGSPAPCNSHVSRCRVCVLTRFPSPLTIVAQRIHLRMFSNGWGTSEEDPQPTRCPSPTRQGQSPPD